MKLLLLLFLCCLVALAWLWHRKPVLRPAETDPLPPTPNPMDSKPMLDRALEHHTEHDFLKRLIAHDASEESRQLQESLTRTERDERCIRRAMFLMAGLLMLSLAGLGYCAVLLPDVFANPRHLLMRGLSYLGLGSLISQGALLGYLLWYRVTAGRLRRECRRLVLALARSHLKVPSTPSLAVHGDPHSEPVSQIVHPAN